MSVTQNFDSYSAGNTAAAAGGGGGAPNADFDLKDAQLDEASAGGAEGQSGILSGGIGQVAQNATQMAKQGADAVVNAGKGIVEMGGSLISGLKRGFSKTSETGGEWAEIWLI